LSFGLRPNLAGRRAAKARGGGNITGLINFEQSIGSKWLQSIKEIAPSVSRVAVIFDSGNSNWIVYLRAIEAAAPSFEVRPVPTGISNAAEIKLAIEAFARESNGGMVVLPGAATVKDRGLIISLAARHRLPTVYPYRYMAADGGLLSYGVDVIDLFRRSASYVDRILKGDKPANLPIEVPTKFELVVNLSTAKALGITIPATLLARADEVIE
jgi:putative tryptophan/tyrosine transport system substrate-binding protein